jgi:hypothetical protein
MTAIAGMARTETRPIYLTIMAGLACAFVAAKALPLTMDAISTMAAAVRGQPSRRLGA